MKSVLLPNSLGKGPENGYVWRNNVPSNMGNRGKSPGIWLLYILLAGFLLRFAFCFLLSFPHQHTDTYMYVDQAYALLHGKYINYAPNGYPLMIALFIKLFGAAYVNPALLGANVLLGTCSIWLVYRIALMTFREERAALIAAAVMALYPNQMNYTRWILTEIPATFFILTCFYLYFRKFNFIGGIVLGISVLFRTPFLLVGFLLAGYELFFKRRVAYRLLAGLALPLILTAVYCYNKTGKFAITGNETVNVVYAVSSYTQETGGEIDWNAPERHPGIQTGSQAWQLYFNHAKDHPVQFMQQRFRSLWELWGFYPSSLGGTREVPSRLLIGLCNLLLIFCGGWSLWKNRRNIRAVLLFFPVISLSAIYVILVSLARYTVPMEPFLIVLASWTMHTFIVYLRRKRNNGKLSPVSPPGVSPAGLSRAGDKHSPGYSPRS